MLHPGDSRPHLWRPLLAFVCAAAALSSMVLPAAAASGAGSERDDDGSAVTVMTYNIYQGTELEHVLAATSLQEFLLGVTTDYSNVIATDFHARADAIAQEIAVDKPALVGLQEVATWRTQSPYDPTTLPATVSYDFLHILLDALAAHGMTYQAVVTRIDFFAMGAGFLPALTGVSLTEGSAIIARTDLPAGQLALSNPQSGAYQSASELPFLGSTFRVGGGWLAIDATVRGRSFRFITTHLDGFSPTIAAAQTGELLQGPGATRLPVVVVGDFNSTTADPAYPEMQAAGFLDEWAVANPGQPGLTCCQVPPDSIINPVSQLSRRIDFVFARGHLKPRNLHLDGDQPSSRTSSGLWPSDHAGLVATLTLDR